MKPGLNLFRRWVFVVVGGLVAMIASAALSGTPVAEVAADGAWQAAGRLSYGTSTGGSVNPNEPLAFYTFDGTVGDLVNVQVVGFTADMNPNVSLLSSTQERLAINNNDVFSPITGDASLSWFLPYSGLYVLAVSDTQNGVSQFVLRLDGRPEVVSPMLQPNVAVRVDIPAGSEEQFFRFEHQSQCFSTLTIIPETPEFAFTAHVRSDVGQSLAVLRGGALRENRVTVPPDSGIYEVEVGAATSDAEGYVLLVLTCAEDAPFCDSAADFGPVDLTLQGGTVNATPVAPTPTPTVTTSAPTDTPVPPTRVPPTRTPTPPPNGSNSSSVNLAYNCTGFGLTSPREGLPNGGITVYWDPAPSATGYQASVINVDNGASTGASVAAPSTSVGLDVSEATLGAGFTFVVRVSALNGTRVICSSEATMFREAPNRPNDSDGGNDDGDGGDSDQCPAGERWICELGDTGTFCHCVQV